MIIFRSMALRVKSNLIQKDDAKDFKKEILYSTIIFLIKIEAFFYPRRLSKERRTRIKFQVIATGCYRRNISCMHFF